MSTYARAAQKHLTEAWELIEHARQNLSKVDGKPGIRAYAELLKIRDRIDEVQRGLKVLS